MNKYEENVYKNLFEYPTKKIVELELKNEDLEKENQQLKKSIKLFTDDLANMTNQALELKKQKDDVVEYIKNKREQLHHSFDEPDWDYLFICNPDDLLRMLGEIE